MTIIKPRSEARCGYIRGFWEKEPSVKDNIKKIQFRTQVGGTPLKTIKVEDFEKEAIRVASAYNPPKIRTILTSTTGGHALACNIQFGNQQVQFVCVDGNRLSQWEFQNPHTVIGRVNNSQLEPIVFQDLNNLSSNDMTKIDAYAGSIWYCLFLWEVFGRVGIIDESHVYLSVVNVDMANAFWNSHYMTYGNGNQPGAPKMGPLTSIDVVGHESGHGIIEALGNLTYQGESGALNESIADIFGTCLEKYYDLRSNKQLFDWDLGEDFMVGGMRSLSNPKSHDQPDTYRGRNWVDPYGQFDNGGVHINSGVNNYFFYSVATGAEGKNDDGTSYSIQKTIEIFNMAKFIYHSLKGSPGYQKITQDFSYHQYADCILNNCEHFLKEMGLSNTLINSIGEGLVAVGLKQRHEIPQVPDQAPVPPNEPAPETPEPNEPETPVPNEPAPVPNEPAPVPNEPAPETPEPAPETPSTTRQIVWGNDFVSTGSPFYSYGISFNTSQGLLTYSGAELMSAFDLSTLSSPQLHLVVDQGSNNLVVNIEVDGQIYRHTELSGHNETQLALNIPKANTPVKITFTVKYGSWWRSGWSLFKYVAFSDLV